MEYRVGRSFRSSLRSKESSSTSDVDPREKIKDCCRKFVAFMCTQVGVGALVVGYTIVGAFSFQYIETRETNPLNDKVKLFLNKTALELWRQAFNCNLIVCNQTAYISGVNQTLLEYQQQLVQYIGDGYNGRLPTDIWTIPTALMFSLSIITMIGYGNMVPRTSWGKGVTVIYAVIGIPLYVLYFLNMGEVLASTFRWIYTWLYNCSTERDEDEPPRRVIVPSSACLWVIGGYVLTGAIMFSTWENWSYLDSTYFCVTSLCKIGLGDFVPGAATGNEPKLVINFIYMLIGLGLVAMCYNLLREEINVKVGELKEDLDVKHLSMLGAVTPGFPIRLCGIVGYEGRINDVVYCHPITRSENQSTVVFFGGDMQDFLENMQSHRDSKNYTKWNLENTASIINASFPESHTVVVRPARIEYKTFSCFKNFVPCNNCGAPDHTPMHFALQHLEKLLQNISSRLKAMKLWEIKKYANSTKTNNEVPDTSNNTETTNEESESNLDEEAFWWRKVLELDRYNLTLIGFSKGTVVLNQFLYEFHYLKTLTPDDHTSMGIVTRIKDMYWLDGGHSGGKNTWITSRPLLETLTRLGIGIHIHVTPYQINDDRRPWIKKEEKLFGDLLKRLGASVERNIHFENVCPTLFIHFDILNAFRGENSKNIAQYVEKPK